MKRISYLDKITTYTARFVVEVEGFNAVGQYHINIHAENFLIPVLNEVFSLQLENLNATQKKNFPAIDLADFKNRVAFQITATADFVKIKDTVKAFFENGLNKQFDQLYIYILTHKKEKYSDDKLKSIIPSDFSFSTKEHIIDKDVLLQKINGISSTPKLEVLAKLFEHEFSDIQIETRKHEFEKGYLRNEPENICPNLLRLTFPDKLFMAELNIDEEGITQRVNDYLISSGKTPIKKMKKYTVVRKALWEMKAVCDDWLLYEGYLYTFKNLGDNKEPLSKVIDSGTVTSLECMDFYSQNEDTNRVFKNLLRKTLGGLCWSRGIEWFGGSEVYRFANNQKHPNQKKVKWKGKNESTKTVIFEMLNKKERHVICYRSLAFRASFLNLGETWYLLLNPTWSFTNPGGYKTSRFESGYMSGLKRLEDNGAVFNYFRFFGYYLSYTDLFTVDYPYLKVHRAEELTFSPSIDEKVWRPAKIASKSLPETPADLDDDNELNKTLFEE